MITIGRYNNDRDCWGISHNLYHRSLLHAYEHIDIRLNSTANDDPPTLKQNSAFSIYVEETPTLSTSAAGNNVLPAATTQVTNYVGEAVFCPNDQVYNWDSTNCLSTGTDGTYYMYCTGADDIGTTSIGVGEIFYSSTIAFTVSAQKGNIPYSTDGYRALAKFAMSSNTLSNLEVFNKPFKCSIKIISTAHTIATDEQYIVASTNITLLSSSESINSIYHVKNKSTDSITIYGQIDGSTSFTLATQYDAITIISNSSEYYIY